MSGLAFLGALGGAIITSKIAGGLFSLDKLQARAVESAALTADDLDNEVDA